MRHMLHRSLGLLLAFCVLITLVGPVWAAPALDVSTTADFSTQTAAVDQALTWLQAQQQDDGSFPAAFGHPAGVTLDAVFAGVAAGQEVTTWTAAEGNPSPIGFLATVAVSYTVSADATGKLVAGLVAAGEDAEAFAGVDYLQKLADYDDGTGAFGTSALEQSWAMLGLAAARAPIGQGAVSALVALQQADGGWESGPGWGTDSTTTAVALEALMAAGTPVTATTTISGLDYLAAQQSPTGGFAHSGANGVDADAGSTASSIQALIATGQNPLAEAWLKDGVSALDALLNLQLPSGAFRVQADGGADLDATVQAIPAILGKPFPLPGIIPARQAALSWLRSQQLADGSFADAFPLSSQALLTLAAADEDPHLWKGSSGASLVEAAVSQVPALRTVGEVGMLVAGLAMANENPYWAGGVNLVAEIQDYYDADIGRFDVNDNIYNHVYALWGLSASGAKVPADAVTWLQDQQNDDGGWGWAAGQPSDSNATAVAVEALIACGVDAQDATIADALAYLHSMQMEDGGFLSNPVWSSASDADSTALAMQAIYTTGADPMVGWDWAQTLTATHEITLTISKPMDALLGFQTSNGGFVGPFGDGDNLRATLDAIPALTRRAFPWQSPTIGAAKRAIVWLKAQQQEDGSFPASGGNAVGSTLDAILAGVSTGEDVSLWTTGTEGASPLDFFASELASCTDTAAHTGKLVAALVAVGRNPHRFGREDIIEALTGFDDGSGDFGTSANVNNQAWATIGFAATEVPVSQDMIGALVTMQNEDGGWGRSAGAISDTSSTAIVIQALVAAGVSADGSAIRDALGYLRTTQDVTGGFARAAGGSADASSTGYGIQAIIAAGQSPTSQDWLVDGSGPLDSLFHLQMPSGGFPDISDTEDVLATARSVPGLLLETNPLHSRGFHDVWLPSIANSAMQ